MLQGKVWKLQTYFVYFKISKPQYCDIRSIILQKND